MAGARDTKRAADRASRKAAMAETENQKRLDSRRKTLETRARVDADNEAAYETNPDAAARRGVPSDERKALAGPAENKTTGLPAGTRRVDPVGKTAESGGGLEGVAFASAAAKAAAEEAGLSAEDFKRKRAGSDAGFNKADVERIAGNRTADEG